MLYKRAPAVVAYWEDGHLLFTNYAKRTRVPVTPDGVAILKALGEWRTIDDVAAVCVNQDRDSVARLVTTYVDAGIVERTGEAANPTERALDTWAEWGPSAAFFHFDT